MNGCQVISVCLASCCPSGRRRGPIWFILLFWDLASANKMEKFTAHVGCARLLVENLRRLSFSHSDTTDTDKEQVVVLVFVFSLKQVWSL